MPASKNYLESLKRCKDIAREEFDYIRKCFSGLDSGMRMLDRDFKRVVDHAEADKNLQATLAKYKISLQEKYVNLQGKRKKKLKQHGDALANFNVMLFGRTMTGKSTLCETLTEGSGSSIGQGGQRTTRDVRSYQWNHLCILDTPGFGAYGGEEDQSRAREILDYVDVVLFILTSDSTQESTFNELVHVHKLNKPLIFVLNVKKDLRKEGNLRRACKNPDKYIYKPEDMDGHAQRLHELAQRAGIDPRHVRIVPIHAQAAFMAYQRAKQATQLDDDEVLVSQLWELGRLDDLLNLLCWEVEVNGAVRRVQTFLESAAHSVGEYLSLLREQGEQLGKLCVGYEAGAKRIEQWRNKLQRAAHERIADDVNRAFRPLIDTVADFIDDHIENRDIAKQWEKHYQSYDVQSKVEQCARELGEQAQQELAEFVKEMNEGIVVDIRVDQIDVGKPFDEWDYKRITSWAGVIVGGLSTVAFSMSWNPLGWGAAAFALLLGGGSYIFNSKKEKLRKAKNQARQNLMQELEKVKSNTRTVLLSWFEKEVLQGMVMRTELQVHVLLQTMRNFERTVDERAKNLRVVQHDIYRRLLYRTAFILTGKYKALPEIRAIKRTPGKISRVWLSGYLKDDVLLANMCEVLKERIEVVAGTIH